MKLKSKSNTKAEASDLIKSIETKLKDSKMNASQLIEFGTIFNQINADLNYCNGLQELKKKSTHKQVNCEFKFSEFILLNNSLPESDRIHYPQEHMKDSFMEFSEEGVFELIGLKHRAELLGKMKINLDNLPRKPSNYDD